MNRYFMLASIDPAHAAGESRTESQEGFLSTTEYEENAMTGPKNAREYIKIDTV